MTDTRTLKQDANMGNLEAQDRLIDALAQPAGEMTLYSKINIEVRVPVAIADNEHFEESFEVTQRSIRTLLVNLQKKYPSVRVSIDD